ncbi:MAG: Fe-S protein assembly co-chaperone HscB [Acidiferrobacteraceae bacterium]
MAVKLPDDYFTLFNLQPVFDVNLTDLATRYRALQRDVHPDRFANSSDSERRHAVQRAAEVNDAFQTLKDPLRRARYLLALKGIETDDETDTVMDSGFLLRQMDLREELEQVRTRQGHDRADALDRLRRDLVSQFDDKTGAFRGAFIDDPARARVVVRELQFLRKLLDEVGYALEDT